MKSNLLLAGAALVLPCLFDWPAHGASFRWANTSNRIYVEGGGSATLTDIKTALPNAPLDLVDPGNRIWLLRADLQIEDGSTLLLYGSFVGGDVDQLLLQSNNSTNFGSFVGVIADWGTLDIRRTAIASWDAAVQGPDTEYQTFGRAFIRVRSRLAPDGVTPLESRMDILASDISYLGYDASESYGLSWKVIGTHPDPSKSIFDVVKVYGDIRNSRIHHNFWAVYTFGLKDGRWLSNELDNNAGYGFDLHDDSDNVLIEGNDVHHNGGLGRGLHGIIASRRCDRVVIRNNRAWSNAGNGIMVHRHSDDCLIENNNSILNGDSGVAIFDSDRTIVRNNLILSNGNAGIRLSVGSANNFLTNNQIGYSGQNGLYYFSGTDPGEPDPVDPTVTVRLRRNTAASNYIHHCLGEAMKIGDSDDNLFIGNVYEANGPEIAVWTSTQIRFVGNSIPPSATVRLYGLLPNQTTTTITTSAIFQEQPLVKLALSDAFTAATFQDERGAIFDFDQPEVATRVIPGGAEVTVTPTQIGAGTTAFMRNLFVSLNSGQALVNPTLWTLSGDSRKQWTTQPSSATTSIRYTVGDFPPYTSCTILKNGQSLSSGLSDESGRVSFADVPGTTSPVQYAAVAGGQPPPQPTVTVAASDASASETASNPATFTFSRTGSTAAALAVRYSIGGTAANGTDYATLSGSVTIPSGGSSAIVTVSPIEDSAVEGNETVVLTLSSEAAYVVGSPNSATVTIADNDQPPPQPTVTVVATDASASETGPDPGRFIISRTGSTASPLIVRYSVGGTAANGADYSTLSGTVTIPTASSAVILTVNPVNDQDAEGDETVVLTLSANAAYLVGPPSSATVTISDNDPPPPSQPTVTVVANDATGSEQGPDPARFMIARTGSTAAALIVRYSVGGTAVNGTDYATLSGTVTIPAASSAVLVTVSPINDNAVEGNETVVLTLSANAAYVVGSPSSATVTISDNDQAPASKPLVSVILTDLIASESGPDAGTFTVSRTGSTATALTVHYSLGGTAVNGVDYESLSGSVTIPVGSDSAQVVVRPVDDSLFEVGEVVILTLTPDASYDLLLSIAVLNLLDNDLLIP
jgi:parallel beta-helix repeat protein